MFHYTSLYEQLFPLFFPLEILSINAKERNDIDLFKESVKKNTTIIIKSHQLYTSHVHCRAKFNSRLSIKKLYRRICLRQRDRDNPSGDEKNKKMDVEIEIQLFQQVIGTFTNIFGV